MSGRFYPSDPVELRAVVATLLADARRDLAPAGPAPARAVVAPHAGYQYSGPTAARTFVSVAVPQLVVILAPNHTGMGTAPGGASLWESGAFRTPLGDVPVDEAFAAALRTASPLVAVDHDAHLAEHAIEVELPLLQGRQPELRLVPLVVAWDSWAEARALGETLARLVQAAAEPVLLVASSDLTHYEPAAIAERKDARALEAVTGLDGAELLARCRREGISMCGRGPAAVILAAARALGGSWGEVVDYRHSGWVSGDHARVVGYAGVVIP